MGYTRNGTPAAGKPLAMDALTYNYASNTNKLTQVTDAVNAGNYIEDIDNQAAGNYTYDANGNMTSDAASGISSIEWTVYGKIKSITKAGGTISYVYDAAGNRISKTVGTKTTVYVRDATGNVMAVYEALGGGVPTQAETHLYGSSRLGIMTPHYEPAPANTVGADYGTARIATFTRGEKFFELSNHLGNVLVTVSDKRMPIDDGYYEMQCYATYPPVPCTYEKLSGSPDGVIDYYTADVVSATDYYPGGMEQPGRTYQAENYAYSFNGKRKDNEMYGEGNAYDFGARILDPRLGGRWLSLDPLMKKYPGESPYLFTGGNPIYFADPDGKDRIVKIYETRNGKTSFLKVAINKGEYVWGTSYSNSNVNMKMNITQDLTINYDNNTVNRSAALITGYQDGKGYDDLEKIWQTVVDKFTEKKGEGSSDRGGWTLTSSSGSGTDAGDVIKGKASGAINTDYIGVITNITSSPGNLKEAIWNFGGSAVTITGTKDENNNPYLPEGLIPVAKDADKQATNTSPETTKFILRRTNGEMVKPGEKHGNWTGTVLSGYRKAPDTVIVH